ncbi:MULTISPECIES: hypothetical protein [Acidiphilium]|uniref:hypothetical protein n=1 Tax=Acidiphilium TaxID=522 RepID=UPI000BD862A4|nr:MULTISPECIES: hypothetical protein [Acidiphilium]OZB21973.1 MAG: hypothetical protein B7X49_17415 [Acidiphilium sp. 34-64-41]HQT86830.1 hypothetical protein [Acidiphilium rubrum]
MGAHEGISPFLGALTHSSASARAMYLTVPSGLIRVAPVAVGAALASARIAVATMPPGDAS